MFTGIIEAIGRVVRIEKEDTNFHYTIGSDFSKDLEIDQSISHNGVCLTVTSLSDHSYRVTAINETILKTNFGHLNEGDIINLERCMVANGRFDGHIVQGHVDQTGKCIAISNENGSWVFRFEYDPKLGNILVEKGSICINGVSLTCFDVSEALFSVAIIPYTYEHTNFQSLQVGELVNLEFDIVGKYVKKLMQNTVFE